MLISPLPRFYGTGSKLVVAFVVPVMVWTGEIFTESVRLRLLTLTTNISLVAVHSFGCSETNIYYRI